MRVVFFLLLAACVPRIGFGFSLEAMDGQGRVYLFRFVSGRIQRLLCDGKAEDACAKFVPNSVVSLEQTKFWSMMEKELMFPISPVLLEDRIKATKTAFDQYAPTDSDNAELAELKKREAAKKKILLAEYRSRLDLTKGFIGLLERNISFDARELAEDKLPEDHPLYKYRNLVRAMIKVTQDYADSENNKRKWKCNGTCYFVYSKNGIDRLIKSEKSLEGIGASSESIRAKMRKDCTGGRVPVGTFDDIRVERAVANYARSFKDGVAFSPLPIGVDAIGRVAVTDTKLQIKCWEIKNAR